METCAFNIFKSLSFNSKVLYISLYISASTQPVNSFWFKSFHYVAISPNKTYDLFQTYVAVSYLLRL